MMWECVGALRGTHWIFLPLSLKPENILLSDKNPTAALKVIDFGTSDFCLPGQHLSQKFGTPYYVAPVGVDVLLTGFWPHPRHY